MRHPELVPAPRSTPGGPGPRSSNFSVASTPPSTGGAPRTSGGGVGVGDDLDQSSRKTTPGLKGAPSTPKQMETDAERVKVVLRVRPCLREDEHGGALDLNEAQAKNRVTLRRPDAPVQLAEFQFDRVLGPGSTQHDVYTAGVKDVVDDVLQGYNGTVMAYGQTGAGKTYTLGNTTPSAIGMIPRCVAEIFKQAAADPFHVYTVSMSYIQIYMELIQDLLHPESENLAIREDVNNGVFVSGVHDVPVTSLEECLHYLELGERNRVFAFTHLNAHSSRSHAVVMVTVVKSRRYLTAQERAEVKKAEKEGVLTQKVKVGKLYMVDLAGSERLKKSKSTGLRASEARSINLSLTTLGMCISARASEERHVPFRDSKLTRLLQESLGGNAKTTLLVCVSDAKEHVDETLQSLQFGGRAMCVKNKPVVNERVDYRLLHAELLGQVDRASDRAHELEAAILRTEEERDALSAALEREKQHFEDIISALRAEATTVSQQVAVVSSELEGTRAAVVCEQARRGELEARCAQLEAERENMAQVHYTQVASLNAQMGELLASHAAALAGHRREAQAAVLELEATRSLLAQAQAQAQALHDANITLQAEVAALSASQESTRVSLAKLHDTMAATLPSEVLVAAGLMADPRTSQMSLEKQFELGSMANQSPVPSTAVTPRNRATAASVCSLPARSTPNRTNTGGLTPRASTQTLTAGAVSEAGAGAPPVPAAGTPPRATAPCSAQATPRTSRAQASYAAALEKARMGAGGSSLAAVAAALGMAPVSPSRPLAGSSTVAAVSALIATPKPAPRPPLQTAAPVAGGLLAGTMAALATPVPGTPAPILGQGQPHDSAEGSPESPAVPLEAAFALSTADGVQLGGRTATASSGADMPPVHATFTAADIIADGALMAPEATAAVVRALQTPPPAPAVAGLSPSAGMPRTSFGGAPTAGVAGTAGRATQCSVLSLELSSEPGVKTNINPAFSSLAGAEAEAAEAVYEVLGGETELTGTAAAIKAQLGTLHRLMAELAAHVAGLRATGASQAAEIEQLRDALMERGQACATLSENLGITGGDLEQARARLAAAEAEGADLRSKVQQLELSLGEHGSDLGVAQAAIQELANHRAQLEAELTAERAALAAAKTAAARTHETRAVLLQERAVLWKRTAAARSIQRTWRAWKAQQLRAHAASEQAARSDLEAAAAEAARAAAAQSAALGAGMVVDSMSVIRDAVEAILTTFVGRRKELALKDRLKARVATAAPLLSQAHRNTTRVAAAASASLVSGAPSTTTAASGMRKGPGGAQGQQGVQVVGGPMAMPRALTLAAPYSAVAPAMSRFTQQGAKLAAAGTGTGAGAAASKPQWRTASGNIVPGAAAGSPTASAVSVTQPMGRRPSASGARRPSDNGATSAIAGTGAGTPVTPLASARVGVSPRTVESAAAEVSAAVATLRQRATTPTRTPRTPRQGGSSTPDSRAVQQRPAVSVAPPAPAPVAIGPAVAAGEAVAESRAAPAQQEEQQRQPEPVAESQRPSDGGVIVKTHFNPSAVLSSVKQVLSQSKALGEAAEADDEHAMMGSDATSPRDAAPPVQRRLLAA